MEEKKKQEEILESEFKSEEEVTETVETKEEQPTLEAKQEKAEEIDAEKISNEEQLTTLDILWRQVFRELDEWTKHADFRDEIFLKEASHFAEAVQRNQGNIAAISDHFKREFAIWEKTARDEFLMSTTSLQHFFPIRSYEEINQQIDQIQDRTMSILSVPCHLIANNQMMDQYLDIVNKYIALRKKGRMQYIKTIKQAANLIYENQKGFMNLFSKQLKTFMFPLNKYMEKTEEFTKTK